VFFDGFNGGRLNKTASRREISLHLPSGTGRSHTP
jgi:hypothetical protein